MPVISAPPSVPGMMTASLGLVHILNFTRLRPSRFGRYFFDCVMLSGMLILMFFQPTKVRSPIGIV